MATATELSNGKAQAPAVREMEFTPFMGKDPIKLSVGIVQRMLCTKTRSGHLPDEVQCIKFMMLCKARQLNPFEGDAYLLGYDTKNGPQFLLITAHQAFLKRAEVHPEYNGTESGVIVKDAAGNIVDRIGAFTLDDDTLLGGWARVYFKSRQHPAEMRVKLATYDTMRSRWEVDKPGMICKVASAQALRTAFPTSLGGLYLADEMESVIDAAAVRKPSRVEASDLTAFAQPVETVVSEEPETIQEPMPQVDAVNAYKDSLEMAVANGDLAEVARIDNEACGPDSALNPTQLSIVEKLVKKAKEKLSSGKASQKSAFDTNENTGQ